MKGKKAVFTEWLFLIFTVIGMGFLIIVTYGLLQNYLGVNELKKIDCSSIGSQDTSKRYSWPSSSKKVVSCFDKCENCGEHELKSERGIHIQSKGGSFIYAIDNGRITDITSHGKVIVEHKNYITKYFRIGAICEGLKENSRVVKGQVIGKTHLKTDNLLFILAEKVNSYSRSIDPLKVFNPQEYNIKLESEECQKRYLPENIR